MTFREYALKYCESRGMFPEQAQSVVQEAINDPGMEPMQGRWDKPVEGYPTVIVNLLTMTLDGVAIRWIDANCPEAWFRPLFLHETSNPSKES